MPYGLITFVDLHAALAIAAFSLQSRVGTAIGVFLLLECLLYVLIELRGIAKAKERQSHEK